LTFPDSRSQDERGEERTLRNRLANLVESYRLAEKQPPPPGNILVHSPLRTPEGSRGFRAWWAQPGRKFISCDCGWRPDLGEHFRVRVLDAADKRPGGK
jgi:hypothetical protein